MAMLKFTVVVVPAGASPALFSFLSRPISVFLRKPVVFVLWERGTVDAVFRAAFL